MLSRSFPVPVQGWALNLKIIGCRTLQECGNLVIDIICFMICHRIELSNFNQLFKLYLTAKETRKLTFKLIEKKNMLNSRNIGYMYTVQLVLHVTYIFLIQHIVFYFQSI